MAKNKSDKTISLEHGADGPISVALKIFPAPVSTDEEMDAFQQLSPEEAIAATLSHLETEVAKYVNNFSTPPLKHLVGEEKVSVLDALVALLDRAKAEHAEGRYANLGMTMYSIGIYIQDLNFQPVLKAKGSSLRTIEQTRAIGSARTKEKSADRHALLRDFAVGFFMDKPSKDYGDAVTAIRNSPTREIRKAADGIKHIDRIIKGTKKIALEKLSKSRA